MTSKGTIEWLLEESQPAVRYLALTQLLGKPKDEAEVQKAKKRIPEKSWAADILREQRPSGMWASDESLYRPKYLSTNWMLLVLSDLGMTRSDPRITQAWIFGFGDTRRATVDSARIECASASSAWSATRRGPS